MLGYINKKLQKYQHKISKKPNITNIHQQQRNQVKQQKKQYHQMNIPILAHIALPVFRKLSVAYFIMPDQSTQQLLCHS